MIKVKGNLTANMKEVRYMIDYLAKTHPIPGKTLIVQPVAQDRVARKTFENAQAVIELGDRSSDEIKVKLCVGKNGKSPPFGVAKSLAHEYRHAIQHYVEGREYKTRRDMMEKDAERFAHQSVAAVMGVMIAAKDI